MNFVLPILVLVFLTLCSHQPQSPITDVSPLFVCWFKHRWWGKDHGRNAECGKQFSGSIEPAVFYQGSMVRSPDFEIGSAPRPTNHGGGCSVELSSRDWTATNLVQRDSILEAISIQECETPRLRNFSVSNNRSPLKDFNTHQF